MCLLLPSAFQSVFSLLLEALCPTYLARTPDCVWCHLVGSVSALHLLIVLEKEFTPAQPSLRFERPTFPPFFFPQSTSASEHSLRSVYITQCPVLDHITIQATCPPPTHSHSLFSTHINHLVHHLHSTSPTDPPLCMTVLLIYLHHLNHLHTLNAIQ